jgi:DNA polymerase III epsilon subunit family exonuclease
MREGKGHSIEKYVADYCVVDLETTGVFISDLEIVEISAIKVRDGKVVDEYNTLVNPKCHIPEAATAVNNITDEMVKNAPVLSDVIDRFMSFVNDDVIVGYNNAGFDNNVLYDKLMSMRGKPFANNYIDVMHAARRSIVNLEDYKLATLSDYFHLDTVGEHRALKDCYLTKACYEGLYKQFGDAAFQKRGFSSGTRSHTIHHTAETKALQTLQFLLEDIIHDGKVTKAEFDGLRRWMEEHVALQGNYPFDRVFTAIDNVLADGVVEPEELADLQELFSEFVDPVSSHSCHDTICSLNGMHVVVTGDFVYGTRAEVFALIARAGGTTDKSITRKTNYLVVGAYGSDAWKTGNYGGKIQKAMEYNSNKGTDIKIVEENDFISAAKKLSGEL